MSFIIHMMKIDIKTLESNTEVKFAIDIKTVTPTARELDHTTTKCCKNKDLDCHSTKYSHIYRPLF